MDIILLLRSLFYIGIGMFILLKTKNIIKAIDKSSEFWVKRNIVTKEYFKRYEKIRKLTAILLLRFFTILFIILGIIYFIRYIKS